MCLERRHASRCGEAPSGRHVPHVGGSGSFSKGWWAGEDITLISESPESLDPVKGTTKNHLIPTGPVSEGFRCTLSILLWCGL
jgi:hypothetical protein